MSEDFFLALHCNLVFIVGVARRVIPMDVRLQSRFEEEPNAVLVSLFLISVVLNVIKFGRV